MLIKIGNKIYDPNVEPLMVILTQKDKENIANMTPEATKYCVFPAEMTRDEVEAFMDNTPDHFIQLETKA